MANYKEMYLKMLHASEQAINILIAAQQGCEELYISQPEPRVVLLPPENKKSVEK